MSLRHLSHLLRAPQVQMGPALIRQAFPVNGLEQVSPFILLHHFDFTKGPGEHDFHVPPHPHRGFCPVTYIFEGSVHHRDSLGNEQLIGAGEVQWISAARGIIHAEKAGADLMEKGGRMQGIQLWINLSAADKMLAPTYMSVFKNMIPTLTQKGVELAVVSGEYKNLLGPAPSKAFTGMLKMEAEATLDLEFAANENVCVYVLEGKVVLNTSHEIEEHTLAVFKNEAGSIYLKCLQASKLLVMAGAPINEPMVSYGPFVMNSQTQIMEAMRDYQEGKMGFLY